MELGKYLRCFYAFIILKVISAQMTEKDLAENFENRDISKAILELLHINKLQVLQQIKPHPYMKQVYQLLNTKNLRQTNDADGTLVQSFRSIQGTVYNTSGWIWFNISHLSPSMTAAELVLLRKILHPEPLTVTVSVHILSAGTGNLSISAPLTEHLLSLNQLSQSGYDVFNVTTALKLPRYGSQALGFQLRFRDEDGSLVLHEALTQTLYCLNSSSLSQPLLVAYRVKPFKEQGLKRRQRHYFRHKIPQTKQQIQPQQWRNASYATCKLYNQYIDVRNIELGQWILQPITFHISFCRHKCMMDHSKRSVKKYKEKDIHKSSLRCIPKGRSLLRVMYRSNTNDIIIKDLSKIRAKRCLCSLMNIN